MSELRQHRLYTSWFGNKNRSLYTIAINLNLDSTNSFLMIFPFSVTCFLIFSFSGSTPAWCWPSTSCLCQWLQPVLFGTWGSCPCLPIPCSRWCRYLQNKIVCFVFSKTHFLRMTKQKFVPIFGDNYIFHTQDNTPLATPVLTMPNKKWRLLMESSEEPTAMLMLMVSHKLWTTLLML